MEKIKSGPNIPESIQTEAEKFFTEKAIREAFKFIRLSKVAVSFEKGSLENYLIVSGIIKDDSSFECKIVYKKRLEDSPEGPLASTCNCQHWREKTHCEHACSLFILYFLRIGHPLENSYEHDSTPPSALNSFLGVTVEEYGTILSGPHQFEGPVQTTSYSALNYVLHNKKIINFPLPIKFEGKIIISYLTPEKIGLNHQRRTLQFLYESVDGETISQISIFENLYLFNWLKGVAYLFDEQLKTFIRSLRFEFIKKDISSILMQIDLLKLNDFVKIRINGEDLANFTTKEPQVRVTLNPSQRKGFTTFSLYFHDETNTATPPSTFFRMLTFTGGILSSFKKKKDCYDFILQLSDDLESENGELYKRKLIGVSDKETIIRNIDHLRSCEKTLLFDEERNLFISYDNSFLVKIFRSLIKNFGELFFRFSNANQIDHEINFELSSSTLFQGINRFHQEMAPFGVSLFYNREQLSKWSGRIRFERNRLSTNWFDLKINISEEDLNIINSADLERGVALSTNGLVLIGQEEKDLIRFMKKYTKYEATQEKGPDDKIKKFVLPFNRARIFELFELEKLGIEGILTEEELELCHKLKNLKSIPQYTIPKALDGVLRPYQLDGFNWLNFLYEFKLGACLADDMGLGKTLQTISFVTSIYDKIDKVLIACPVSLLLNWVQEFEKFSSIDAFIYHGDSRNFPTDKKVILTSYGVLKREIDTTFSNVKFDLFVLDEVQHLKNIRSLGAYAARKIKADFRICLTGTPVENDLAEFYNILDLSIPGVWGDLQFIRTTSTQKSRLLARKTAAPFILRRTKAQVLSDLPPKLENNVVLSLSEDERKFYDEKLKNIRLRIQSSTSKRKYGEILKGLLELRQSCLWQKHDNRSGHHFRHCESTKIEFLMETLEQILEEGHQAIVFSQFTTYLDIIQTAVAEKNWKHVRIDGSQSVAKRHEQVEKFQAGEAPIFLISLKAGGVGLNLTAASYVFIMDPWWNPAVENQAIDRAHRIGQKNRLTVYRPIIENSVEEKVLKLQEIKKELFQELLPDDNAELFTGKLSTKDFEDLFQ